MLDEESQGPTASEKELVEHVHVAVSDPAHEHGGLAVVHPVGDVRLLTTEQAAGPFAGECAAREDFGGRGGAGDALRARSVARCCGDAFTEPDR